MKSFLQGSWRFVLPKQQATEHYWQSKQLIMQKEKYQAQMKK